MSFDKKNYVEFVITNNLKLLTEGKASQNDIDWATMNMEVRRCREMHFMDEVHIQMQPYYEMLIHADPKLFTGRVGFLYHFVLNTAEVDDQFASWAQKYKLLDMTEDWSDYLRKTDSDFHYYEKLIRILLEGGYDTNWQDLSEQLKLNLHEAEVYSDYKTGELMCFLHGVAMLMNTPWDDDKKMEFFDLFCDNWDFMKHFYSVMIRRVIGCKLPNFAAVANLVAQQPRYHQYIHLFFCALCFREDSLNLKKKQLKTLEERMAHIRNIMDETKPSEALNELCDTLFPEDFQRMLDEFRPETREQVEKERNKLRMEVGLLTTQLSEMAMKLKTALERSVPISDIECQLLRLTPGAALDICGQLTMMLTNNVAWMSSVAEIREKILKKKEEQERQLSEAMRTMAEKRSVEVKVENGGTAQITEHGDIRNLAELPENIMSEKLLENENKNRIGG